MMDEITLKVKKKYIYVCMHEYGEGGRVEGGERLNSGYLNLHCHYCILSVYKPRGG